jgi:hypothetical protein
MQVEGGDALRRGPLARARPTTMKNQKAETALRPALADISNDAIVLDANHNTNVSVLLSSFHVLVVVLAFFFSVWSATRLLDVFSSRAVFALLLWF